MNKSFMKYIIINHKGILEPFLFSSEWTHVGFAEQINAYSEVVATGIVEHTVRGVRCYDDDTIAIGYRSRGDVDAQIIERYLRGSDAEDLPLRNALGPIDRFSLE